MSAGILRHEAGLLETFAPEGKQAVGVGALGQLGAARAIGPEGDKASVEREDVRGRLSCLLGIAVDTAHLVLGRRVYDGAHQVAALCLHGSQALEVRLLTKCGTCPLERR